MTADAALARLQRAYPALPSEAAPVYFLLCGEDVLTAPAIARRLRSAQSTVLRHLALLAENGLVEKATAPAKQTPRWTLTSQGQAFAQTLMAS
jgi:DNA-binding MarR family transcriptional regulator